MILNLSQPQDIVCAKLKNLLETKLKSAEWEYDILEDGGAIEYVFLHKDFGDSGKAILHKSPGNKSQLIIIQPAIPTDNEIQILIDRGKLIYEYAEVISLLLSLNSAENGSSKDDYLLNKLWYGVDNEKIQKEWGDIFDEDTDFELIIDPEKVSLEESHNALVEFAKLRKGVMRHRQEVYRVIDDEIVSFLYRENLWPVSEWLVLLGESGVGRSATDIFVPMQLDVFDAATQDCLPGYAPGNVGYTRVVSGSLIIYFLTYDQLGNLGELRLRKLSEKKTLLALNHVPYPTEEETLKYYSSLANHEWSKEAERLLKRKQALEFDPDLYIPILREDDEKLHGQDGVGEILKITSKIRELRKELLHKREVHRGMVIQAYFNRLNVDGIWRLNDPKQTSVVKPETKQGNHDIYLPKKDKTIKQWKECYAIIITLRETYRELWEEFGDDPNLTKGDCRDAIRKEKDLKYSEKSIDRIIKAGDAGLLN